MSESKPTHGPWHFSRNEVKKLWQDDKCHRCTTFIAEACRAQDVTIIASAPELLEALELMLELADDPNNYAGFSDHFSAAHAAIAKARGESD